MGQAIDDSVLDILFREARTHFKWQPKAVAEQTLRDLYDILNWAPTSANTAPARFAFLRSQEAKERLRPALAPGNIEKTMTAPVTVIVGYDMKFYDQVPKLFHQSPGLKQMFEGNPQLVEVTAQRNSSLQGAYLILAARALGLDCGPMSSTTPRWTKSFLPLGSRASVAIRSSSLKVTSSLISFAILDTVIQVCYSLDFHVCRSARRVPSCRIDGRY